MATAVMSAPFLAPRPSPRPSPWQLPPHLAGRDGKENRPAPKEVQQSTPSASRGRRERPCDGCRRRKSKCVLQESRKCVLCEFHKQSCTFVEDAQPRKRKLQDDSTGSRKSSTAPSATSSKSGGPRTHTQREIAPARSPYRFTPPPPSHASSSLAVAVPATDVADPAPSSPPQPPMAIDESLSLQPHRHCKYLGQTTALDAMVISLSPFDSKRETASRLGLLRQATETEYFSTHADADVLLPADEARALAEIDATVGPHGPALIDVYFRNVHPSYPIIQKQAFLDRHRYGDRQFNPPLLASMYLLALTWWESEPSLAAYPRPDEDRLEYVAFTSLTISMQRPKMSTVQAGLLLLQRGKASTWTMTVQLVSIAQDIGFHLDCTNWAIPLWERRLRKRLAWGLYLQDKWSALVHGRPSHINSVDWAVLPLTENDFDETTPYAIDAHNSEDAQISHGRMHFMQMISLTVIMAEVCGTFYSQTAVAEFRRAGRHATQLVLNRAKPVQIRLKDWFAKLPADCKIDTGIASSPASPTDPIGCNLATGALHLAYFATEITIHRRIVQSLVPSIAPLGSSSPNEQLRALSTVDPYMLYICRSAAKTRLISAMDFVNRLTPSHLNSFWYFASSSNFALIGTFGALLQATSPGAEEADFYAARLREFQWTLSVSVPRASWIEGAIETVEASVEMLNGLGQKPRVALGEGRIQWESAAAAPPAEKVQVTAERDELDGMEDDEELEDEGYDEDDNDNGDDDDED